MTRVRLTLSCCEYDRTRALVDGRVQAEGLDLNVISSLPARETIIRMLRYQEFDAAEMSISAALIAIQKEHPPFVLLPIFPSRYFRHSSIFINSDAGIHRPEDLRGKRVGVPAYCRLTAAVWVRGIMEDEYGISPKDVSWVVEERLPVGSEDNIEVELDPGLVINSTPSHRRLEDLLVHGEIDVLISSRAPESFFQGSGKIRRLFPNFRGAEREYFERTGIFPPMHILVVNQSLYEENPWVGPSLFRAFVRSKQICSQDINDTELARYSLAWWIDYLEDERRILGNDPWMYGVEANSKALETFIGYCHRQGLIERALSLREIFPTNVLQLGEET